jgi:hypothetical protein
MRRHDRFGFARVQDVRPRQAGGRTRDDERTVPGSPVSTDHPTTRHVPGYFSLMTVFNATENRKRGLKSVAKAIIASER